ncbi:hypothetical protein ACI50E_08165 [Brucella sp. ZJ1_1]|uniref:Uncharacterized protein n=2 Tax=Brucella intermedia TaxID=94625 RepID=C4WKW2_9HYPH|nr:hypothetical protein [Brucella intermedia]HCH72463.1 hypothetical protein [Ochrobactrum sp.]EEQ92888.1 Hypothetical protein OINT_2000010 [Brucella intermedia LMG 3301]ELT48177.1 hypothetical protein D584_15108 [Brucella intermedia M86]NYD80627.1 hypothetical protein [Brucella intermedia]OOC65242.1 hypothetical protein AS855_09120 [Brucella intermedia M86]
MDEALDLGSYLPRSFSNASEQAYLDFLWSAFQTNYEAERFEFASLAFHLLYMSFVSFSIWQIRLARPEQFAMAMVGFRSDEEGSLMDCESPFKFYDRLKESQIFRFLKLIGCSNQQVGEFAKFVKRRNKIAHPTGTVFFNDRAAIDAEIADMMREVRNIEMHMEPVILELYRRFLISSSDVEERQYTDPADEIAANLVHANYMSSADIGICSDFDVSALAGEAHYDEIQALHAKLLELYPPEDMEDAA